MTLLLQDVRYAARSLAKSPGLTAAAVLTLALGVGANTTVFAWVRAVLLDPIPGATDPGRLRVVMGRAPSGEWARISYPDFKELERRGDPLDGLLAQRWVTMSLGATTGQPAPQLSGALVSANYFDLLGVRPLLGRGFRPEEEAGRGAPPAAVLSHALWRRSFGSDPGIVGRHVLLNGQPFTVIGVAPPNFFGSFLGIGVDVWVPLVQVGRFDPSADRLEDRGNRWLLCLARLKPHATTAQAQAALEGDVARLEHEEPGTHEGYRIAVLAVSDSPWGGPAEFGPVLSTLAALVSVVLLIACASVANLLLNRALGRRREIALRLALGANRGRIVRQMLLEGLALAALAGAAAAIATFWTAGLLLSFVPPTGLPVRLDLGVDGRVVAFALGISLVGSLLFSLVPSLQGSRVPVASVLAGSGATVTGTRGRARLRGVLVASQIALSVLLLAAAALFLRSLSASRRLDPGFDTRRLLLVQLKLFSAGYTPERSATFFDRLERRARQIPGVRAAALAGRVPLGFGAFSSKVVSVEGYAPRRGEEVRARFNDVSAGYLRTMGLLLRSGREFEPGDRAGALPVVMVNETFARRYFPGREALGGRIQSDGTWRRVVGVVADSKYEKLAERPLPFLFLPLAQTYREDVVLHLRTSGDPAAVLPAVVEAVRGLDPNLPLFEVQTMEQHLGEELFNQRVGSRLLGALGLLALLISGVGLYALAAHSVAERRREIALRMALGASPPRLLRSFLAGALRLAGAGVLFGLGMTLVVGRLIAGQLPGIAPSDPAALSSAALIVASIAVAAGYLSARKASRVDPMAALRSE